MSASVVVVAEVSEELTKAVREALAKGATLPMLMVVAYQNGGHPNLIERAKQVHSIIGKP